MNYSHYIKEITKNNIDERIHKKFVRYSRGIFTGPLIKITKSKSSIKIKSSFHIVDELLYLAIKYSSEKVTNVKGVIKYNKDLSDKFQEIGLKYIKTTKLRGIYTYTIDNEIDLEKFFVLFSGYNPLVNFVTEKTKITTKKKFPKPDKDLSDSFCYVELPFEAESEVMDMFCFDVENKNFKSIKIYHKIIVEEIVFPKIENNNFEELRRLAKRKGKIERIIEVDKEKKISSFNFIC